MNIFLTGKINIGKSTIINNFLRQFKETATGYRTVRKQTELDDFYGIYLLDINDSAGKLSLDNRVGDCFRDRRLVCKENVFETLGVKLLSDYKNSDIVIMDEIGVLEKNCSLFKKKIVEILDSNTNVLGVIKQKDHAFLNSIRSRDDVSVFEITLNNNTEVLNHIIEVFNL